MTPTAGFLEGGERWNSESKGLGTCRRKGPGGLAVQEEEWEQSNPAALLNTEPQPGCQNNSRGEGLPCPAPERHHRPGGIQLWLKLGGIGRGSSP